jgi:hypothetical protein
MKTITTAFNRQINSTFCHFDRVSTFPKLLILGIAMLFFIPDSAQAQVGYKVTMVTGDNGADNSVYLRLYGTNSPRTLKDASGQILWDQIPYLNVGLFNSDRNDREAGQTDVYTIWSGSGNVKDVGIVTDVHIGGNSGRDWKLDKLVIERIIAPGVDPEAYPNAPFKSTFTTFNELIYGSYIERGADNKNQVTPKMIQGTQTGKQQMFAYSGFKQDLRGTSGDSKTITTVTKSTASKGSSVSNKMSESSRNRWEVAVKTALESETLFGTWSNEFSFTSETEVSTGREDTKSESTATEFFMSRAATNTFDKGFLTWVIYETVMDVEEYRAQFLGNTYDMIKPYADNMRSGNTYEFKFGPNDPIPPEFERIYLGKMVDKDAYNFLTSYKKPVTNNQVAQTSTTKTEVSTETPPPPPPAPVPNPGVEKTTTSEVEVCDNAGNVIGYFKKNGNGWVETDLYGATKFRFSETRSDQGVIYLSDKDRQGVKINLDLTNKEVLYSDRNNTTPFGIYIISKVK